MIDTDSSVFFSEEFTIPVTLRFSDFSRVEKTRGIVEDAVTDEQLTSSERALHSTLQPQVTVPYESAVDVEEGDTVEHSNREFLIVDKITDRVQTTLLLRKR